MPRKSSKKEAPKEDEECCCSGHGHESHDACGGVRPEQVEEMVLGFQNIMETNILMRSVVQLLIEKGLITDKELEKKVQEMFADFKSQMEREMTAQKAQDNKRIKLA